MKEINSSIRIFLLSFIILSCNENFHLTETTDQEIPFSRLQETYAFTGADQFSTVPNGASTLTVKIWGAGGGGGREYNNVLNLGGAGSYSEALFNVNDFTSSDLVVVVGGGGIHWDDLAAQNSPYRLGGAAGSGGCALGTSASGGGLVGVFLNSISQTNALIISGSGGGASNSNGSVGDTFTSRGGAGGTHTIIATDGSDSIQSGSVFGGERGTASAGGNGGAGMDTGINGGSLFGGTGASSASRPCGGGGGAGYFGGGGGGSGGGFADAPGGGGSGYIAPIGVIVNEVVSIDISAPNVLDTDYPGNQVGVGGDMSRDGGNGYIVLIWE